MLQPGDQLSWHHRVPWALPGPGGRPGLHTQPAGEWLCGKLHPEPALQGRGEGDQWPSYMEAEVIKTKYLGSVCLMWESWSESVNQSWRDEFGHWHWQTIAFLELLTEQKRGLTENLLCLVHVQRLHEPATGCKRGALVIPSASAFVSADIIRPDYNERDPPDKQCPACPLSLSLFWLCMPRTPG